MRAVVRTPARRPTKPALVGGDLYVTSAAIGLDDIGVGNLAKAAVRASFADHALQEKLLDEIGAYVASA